MPFIYNGRVTNEKAISEEDTDMESKETQVYLMSADRQINDVHPMGYLRVNCTLQQFDKFLDFYGIKEGDGMYLAPEDRVLIW